MGVQSHERATPDAGATGKDGPQASPVGLPPAPSVTSFVHTREPEQSWQSRLWQMFPPSDYKAKMVIWWEPGDTWEPIQRWVIYQVMPYQTKVRGRVVDAVPPQIRKQLEGPHPRSSGFYSEMYERWMNGPAPLITKTAWEIARVHKGWARPYWIVQGDKGGHRYRAFSWEKYLSKMAGGTGQLPLAGDLPYAEPDEQTWDALGQAGRWHSAALGAAGLALKHPAQLSPDEWDMVKNIAGSYSKWMGDQIAEDADELAFALRKAEVPRPVGFKPEAIDYDAEEEDRVNDLAYSITGSRPTL